MTNLIHTLQTYYIDPSFLAIALGMFMFFVVGCSWGLAWGAWNHPIEHKLYSRDSITIDEIGEMVKQDHSTKCPNCGDINRVGNRCGCE